MAEAKLCSYLQYVEREYQRLGGGEVMLAYEGEVSQSLILSLTGLIELEIVKSGEDAKLQKQLFHTLVEGLQNIMKHADPIEGERMTMFSGRGVVMLIRTPVKNANDDELKAMHRASLRGNEISEKGGAGLGLIDMARKAQDIDYRFEVINEERQFYLLEVKLKR